MIPTAYRTHHQKRLASGAGQSHVLRDRLLAGGVVFAVLVIALRLGQLQIVQGHFYSSLASGQHDIFDKLLPERGQILVRERKSDSLYPVATNRDLWTVYSDNRKVTDSAAEAKALAPLFVAPVDPKDKTPQQLVAEIKQALVDKEAEIAKRLAVPTNQYAPLMRGADGPLTDKVKVFNFPNINFAPEKARYYPEPGFGGQLLGFLGYDGNEKVGRYGIEGYWDKQLSGTQGYLSVSQGAAGGDDFAAKQDGSDVVLTVDRTLQAYVCDKLKAAVKQHESTGGAAVMLDPETGAVMAMCGAPDFDPNAYSKTADQSAFNNPAIWASYEPGSVMKAVTMAAAIDTGVVTPATTYNDPGEEKYGDKVIKNSDHQSHGVQTMVDVLDKSLNTGAIFAMRKTGIDRFKSYMYAFGFGTRTGIELDTEAAGNLAPLKNKGEINAATASFGQGITVTPLQMAVAYGALANGGNLMRPYIVDEIVHPDGTTVKTQPRTVRQVVSDRTASLITGMLVSVVKNGHGKRAAVPGYLVAGKTGTAQVASSDRTGYDATATIGTFAGYAPVSDPRFVLVVRIDKPKDVQFAESSAAPLFGDIASFTLKYLEVPPDDTH